MQYTPTLCGANPELTPEEAVGYAREVLCARAPDLAMKALAILEAAALGTRIGDKSYPPDANQIRAAKAILDLVEKLSRRPRIYVAQRPTCAARCRAPRIFHQQ